jgi:hypothetical protein
MRPFTCVHCGAVVTLEPRGDGGGAELRAHLGSVHAGLVTVPQARRWAELLEHFFVIPMSRDARLDAPARRAGR